MKTSEICGLSHSTCDFFLMYVFSALSARIQLHCIMGVAEVVEIYISKSGQIKPNNLHR